MSDTDAVSVLSGNSPIGAPPDIGTPAPQPPPSLGAQAPPTPPPPPINSVWSEVVKGALAGLAGSRGATHFGGGLAAGAGGYLQEKQQEVENAQKAQQLQFESARAADSHITALNAAREADDAHAEHAQQLADNQLVYAQTQKALGFSPTITIASDNTNDTHAQAVGAHTTLANRNGGVLPGVATTNSPAQANDDGVHTIHVYSPNASDIQQNATKARNLVDEVSRIKTGGPIPDATWNSGNGAMLGKIPDPQGGQARMALEAQQYLLAPPTSKDDAENSATSANIHQELDRYQQAIGDSPTPQQTAILSALQSKVKTFDSAMQNKKTSDIQLENRNTAGTADAQAQAAALKVVAENSGPAENAKVAAKQREAQVEQNVKDGNPASAGRLLAQRVTTISELKSRGATPQYIANAIQAAQSLDPNYNAILEDNNAKIAGSEANNQFFGNANSLVTPGGTLDQLKDAGTKISQSDWQILNKTKNWSDLQSGKAGISAYAAKVVGVSDDLAKVMGGSTGSDTARKIVSAIVDPSLSPDQRSAAVEAVRDSVNSQKDARIGNNSFLKKMYGTMPTPTQPQGGGAPPAGATHTGKGSDGNMYYLTASGQVLGKVQ
jgi:hypothetical protein